MNCLRCGRETDEDQAFCLECQKEMAKYPIDPNAVVQLPVRRQPQPRKPAKRRIPPEEQIRLLKLRIRLYACLLAVALIAVVCLAIPVIHGIGQQKFAIGQNYSTVKTETEATAPSAE